MKPLDIPPTRNHRQLAAWINAQPLVDAAGRRVVATVKESFSRTDRQWAGTRHLRKGRGRRGLELEIWPMCDDGEPVVVPGTGLCWDVPASRLFYHDTSETYRRHEEARRWVSQNLRRSRRRRAS